MITRLENITKGNGKADKMGVGWKYRLDKGELRTLESNNLDGQKVGEEVVGLWHRDGKIVTEEFLKLGESPSSETHAAYTWDDAKAAHEHRLNQARALLRSILVIKRPDTEPEPLVVNVRGRVVQESYYQLVQCAVRNVDEWTMVLREYTARVNQAMAALRELQRIAAGKKGVKSKIKKAGDALKTAHDVMQPPEKPKPNGTV